MKYLRNFRLAKGVSQQTVADYLEITRQAYSNYESGNREPDFETLLKLGEFFNVSVDVLLRGPEPQKAPTPDGELSDTEWELVSRFRRLNRQGKEFILQCLAVAENTYTGDNTISMVEKTS